MGSHMANRWHGLRSSLHKDELLSHANGCLFAEGEGQSNSAKPQSCAMRQQEICQTKPNVGDFVICRATVTKNPKA